MLTILTSRESWRRAASRIRAAAGTDVAFVFPEESGGWRGPFESTEVALFSEGLWTPDLASGPLRAITRLPELRWLHTETSGTDHPLFEDLLRRGVVLTHSAGTMSRPMAEFAIGLMLRVVKRMDVWAHAQREHRWIHTRSDECEELAGKTLGVVGLGHVGCAVARLARLLDMRVLGCSRSRRPLEDVDLESIVGADAVRSMIERCDFVVLAVPLTSETRNLFGREEFLAMPTHSWLINLSRGAVVDEAALEVALCKGWLAGACLDVLSTEPLPPTSGLWDVPNAIITPHVSATSSGFVERVLDRFLDLLQRYRAGEALAHVVGGA